MGPEGKTLFGLKVSMMAVVWTHGSQSQIRNGYGDSAKLQEVTIGEVGEVLGEDASIPVLLQRRQLHPYNLLLLGWQLLQHILLQPPQQVRGQQLMQLCYLHACAQAPSFRRLPQGGSRQCPVLVLAIQLPYGEKKRLHIALTSDSTAFAELLLANMTTQTSAHQAVAKQRW